MVVSGFLALLMAAPELHIEAQPPGTHCPVREDLTRAIAARSGASGPAGQGWMVLYQVDSRTDPEVLNLVTLEIRAPDGQAKLRRALTVGDGSCAGAAEAMALIIERFFRGVQWTAAVPLPEIEREPEAPVVEPIRALALRAGPLVRRNLRLADPGLSLDLNWRFARRLAGAAGVVLLPFAYKDPTDTSIQVWSIPVRSSLRAAWTADPFDLQVGPELVLSIEGARRVANPTVHRVYLSAGVVGSVSVSASERWGVTLEASAGWNLPRAAFQVAGGPPTFDNPDGNMEVLNPPRLQAAVTLQLAYVLSP
jgi:hypothetical protein